MLKAIGAITAVAILATAPRIGAQTIWTGLERPEGLHIEAYHPELDGDTFGALSSVVFVGGRLEASPGLRLVADLPLAYADAEGASDLAVGAPYFGVEWVRANRVIEAGVRAPTASSNFGAALGSAAEFVDRLGSFSSNAAVVTAAGVYGGTSAGGFVHRIRLGPRVLIPTEGGDTEIIVDYGGVIGYATPTFGIEGGLTGWALVTEDAGGLGERTVHQVGFQAYRPLADGGRLGVLLRLPLDKDVADFQDFSVGLIATIALR
jgi:hypothetical protein